MSLVQSGPCFAEFLSHSKRVVYRAFRAPRFHEARCTSSEFSHKSEKSTMSLISKLSDRDEKVRSRIRRWFSKLKTRIRVVDPASPSRTRNPEPAFDRGMEIGSFPHVPELSLDSEFETFRSVQISTDPLEGLEPLVLHCLTLKFGGSPDTESLNFFYQRFLSCHAFF